MMRISQIWDNSRTSGRRSSGNFAPEPCRRRAGRGPLTTLARALVSSLEAGLDQAAAAHPQPGAPTIHRLNRTEYANAVRDLLGLEIDGRALLPADDADKHGLTTLPTCCRCPLHSSIDI